MEGELKNLINVSLWVTACMIYARFASSKIAPGWPRFAVLLPVLLLLPLLPLSFSTSHLRGISGFFLGWLAIFKLLLLAFGLGPLHPSLSLPVFVAVSSLPVKLRTNSSKPPPKSSALALGSAVKALLLAVILSLYNFKHQFHLYFLLALYCVHIYLSLELVLTSARFLAGTVLGLDLEPQFDAPYRSTCLRDFWGRRWNLMVTGILRPSVYNPIRARFGPVAGVLAAFLVSGIMHELMFYYISSAVPTGEVTCFFVLHGVCAVAEGMAARRMKGRCSGVHPVIAALMVMGFVGGTGFWLFFPPLVRARTDERTLEECAALMAWFEKCGRVLVDRVGSVLSRFWSNASV